MVVAPFFVFKFGVIGAFHSSVGEAFRLPQNNKALSYQKIFVFGGRGDPSPTNWNGTKNCNLFSPLNYTTTFPVPQPFAANSRKKGASARGQKLLWLIYGTTSTTPSKVTVQSS
jgi:hypothetical protein